MSTNLVFKLWNVVKLRDISLNLKKMLESEKERKQKERKAKRITVVGHVLLLHH